MITNKEPKINTKKNHIYLKNKEGEPLYFFFNELSDDNKLNNIKDYKLAKSKIQIIVRWFDWYNIKDYKIIYKLKTILKKGLAQILEIIKKKNLNMDSLNGSGLAYIIKQKNKIFIEPQFS